MRRLVVLLLLAAVAALAGGSSLPGLAGDDPDPRRARLERVVDGDTVEVRLGGRSEHVRLIGIDTPESVRPGTPVECGATAAARALRRDVRRGERVRLVFDATQDRRDRYGRLLAYVQRADGTDLGAAQVRAGWAAVYVFDGRPFDRALAYRRAFDRARAGGRGVHGRCGGDFHRPR